MLVFKEIQLKYFKPLSIFKLIYNNFYFKIAWAPSKGIKDKLKNNWNVDIGCTYVPWSELNNIDINFVN